MGRVRDINGNKDVDAVYVDTRAALVPNLLFLYGPPVPHIQAAAEFIQDRMNYTIINPADFYKKKGLTDAIDEIKIDNLMKYLDSHASRNFVLTNFPENVRQAKTP